MLLLINLFWPILNLLPIWPLDGGMITREVCIGTAPSRGLIISLWISLLFSATIAIHAALATQGKGFIPHLGGSIYMAIVFALFAAESFQAIQIESSQRRRRSYDDELPW